MIKSSNTGLEIESTMIENGSNFPTLPATCDDVSMMTGSLFWESVIHSISLEATCTPSKTVFVVNNRCGRPSAKKQFFGKTQNPVLVVSRKTEDTVGVLGAHQFVDKLDPGRVGRTLAPLVNISNWGGDL